MDKIIVILGPTGVGKTKLSIELAKYYNGEIINADSMQIYKDLNIGTAKIKEEEKEGIIHHLFDIKEVSENYSIYDYQKDCRKKIEEIKNKGKTAIMVGGTGLYIKSALYNYQLSSEKNNNTYDDLTNNQLYQKLITLDPNIKIDKNNRRRLIRALNYYLENNHSINDNKKGNELLYEVFFIGLTCDRKLLYEKINNRVDEMIKEGLIEEVKKFYDKKIYSKPIINGIGYKELYSYFENKISLNEAIDLIKKNSRHYAKKQYTFFNNQMNVKWFEVNFNNFQETVDNVKQFIGGTNDK